MQGLVEQIGDDGMAFEQAVAIANLHEILQRVDCSHPDQNGQQAKRMGERRAGLRHKDDPAVHQEPGPPCQLACKDPVRLSRIICDEMTQQQLADKVGVTRQTIVAIEKGKYSPSLELAFRIAQVFRTPIGEVFSYDSENETNQAGD